MAIALDLVDAFSTQPFAGNPAAVCLLSPPHVARWHDSAWCQQVAAEMNLSETAFVWAKMGAWHIRYFTPTVEVDFCGHATLATAHVLWQRGEAHGDQAVEFVLSSGERVLCQRQSADPSVGQSTAKIAMDCPRRELGIAFSAHDPNLALVERALGVVAQAVYRGPDNWFAILTSEHQVRQLAPDLGAIASMGRGLVVSALSDDPQVDFVSRCFFPAAGIPEDPVTGSAHAALAPYWAQRLSKRHLLAQQVSKRGGHLWLEDRGERVVVSGYCCSVSRGEWVASP